MSSTTSEPMGAFTAITATSALLLMLASLSSAVRAQDNPAQNLTLIGTSGGTSTSVQCPGGSVLTGLRAQLGPTIVALGIKCRPINTDGSLGSEIVGTTLIPASVVPAPLHTASCPPGSVVSGQGGSSAFPIGLRVFAFKCKEWNRSTRSMGSTSATVRFNAGVQVPSAIVSLVTSGTQPAIENVSNCSRNTQPVVKLRARVGVIVDAAGFSCDDP